MRIRPVALAVLLLAPAAHAQTEFCPTPGENLAVAQDQFPTLAAIAGPNSPVTADFALYACRMAYEAYNLRSSEALESLAALRARVIAGLSPRVDAYMSANDVQMGASSGDAFEQELVGLGLVPVAAEGFYFDVAPGSLLPVKAAAYASPAFRALLDFEAAMGMTRGGEYPFSSLAPTLDALLIGERLLDAHAEGAHAAQVREQVAELALTLFSVHPGPEDMVFAGTMTSEFYPWASELESLQALGRMGERSRFSQAAARVAAAPSRSAEGDHLAVVVGRYPSYTAAREAVVEHLLAGRDVPVAMGLAEEEGGPATAFLAVYRYVPAGDRAGAEAFAAAARDLGLSPEIVPVRAVQVRGPE